MKAQEILDRIEYKPECHHCFGEEEVINAMKKYAQTKCKEQAKLFEEYLQKNTSKKNKIPMPEFE